MEKEKRREENKTIRIPIKNEGEKKPVSLTDRERKDEKARETSLGGF